MASAKEELRAAERLDPQLAEVHVARSFILWSQYGGWQTEAALREARLAKELDPNVDNLPLPVLYFHMGLEDRGAEEFERALERDPTSDLFKNTYCDQYSLLAMPDEWLALYQRLFNGRPEILHWYYIQKRMVKEAAPLVEQEYAKSPDNPIWGGAMSQLLALQGRRKEAEALGLRLVGKAPKDKYYHHVTYDLARIYALDGNGAEALRWLRATVEAGFPCYTLFARDPYLDRIRQDPDFVQFMAEMKNRWEGYRREFG
jgi:tetratricopeptide (TPR) repeat protein